MKNATLRRVWQKIKTNGCTASPDLWFHECCDDHDRTYGSGLDRRGNPTTRWRADIALFRCIRRRRARNPLTGWIIPGIYWTAVRIFGGKFWKPPNKSE